MKFHLLKEGTDRSVCGVKITPEKFGYDTKGFYNHYAHDMRCSKCINIDYKPLILRKVK